VHTGYGWGDTHAQLTSIDGTYDVDGWLGGGQVGYDWQFGTFVLGVVGDVSVTNAGGAWVFDPPRTLTTDYDVLGTARVRAGFAFDRFMAYATGGLALASIDSARSAPAANASDMMAGFAIGAGIEWACSDMWSVQVEFLHREFGTQHLDNYRLDHDLNTFTIGVNLRF
jgi:outer membrane immunogenic protein